MRIAIGRKKISDWDVKQMKEKEKKTFLYKTDADQQNIQWLLLASQTED